MPERKCNGNFPKDRKIHGESNVWSTAQRPTYLMFMLGLKETVDQLVMANSVLSNGHVLRRALDFEVGCQSKKGRPKRKWKKQVEEESMKVSLRRKDAPCRSKWSTNVKKIAAELR